MPVSKFLRINKLHTVGNLLYKGQFLGNYCKFKVNKNEIIEAILVLDIGEKGLKDYFNNYNIIFLSSDFLWRTDWWCLLSSRIKLVDIVGLEIIPFSWPAKLISKNCSFFQKEIFSKMNLKWNQFMMLEVPWFYNIKQRDIESRIVGMVRLFVIKISCGA